MVRRFVLIFCFLIGSLSLAHGQKTRFSQVGPKNDPAKFPLHVHISGSKMRYNCDGSSGTVGCDVSTFADALIDGKKLELWGKATIGKYRFAVLAPGDYLAQITDETHNADSSVISRNYLLLLPDGTTWKCTLSGISE